MEREERDELAKLGLTPEILAEAQALATDLAEAEGALSVLRDAQRRERERLYDGERRAEELYARAEAAMRADDEEGARTALVERKQRVLPAIADGKAALEEATRRVSRAQDAVDVLAGRCTALERIIEGGAVNAAELKARSAAVQDLGDDVGVAGSFDSFDALEREFRKK